MSDAIGKKGNAEGCAWVEMLADEEVAVVEGCGCECDYCLVEKRLV